MKQLLVLAASVAMLSLFLAEVQADTMPQVLRLSRRILISALSLFIAVISNA